MKIIESFKSPKRINRFNKGQRIWIQYKFANHSYVIYKYRNRGRWVKGIIDNIFFEGQTQQFEVDDRFYDLLMRI